MRCRRIRKVLFDESEVGSPAVQEHVRNCASCAAELHQWQTLRRGLRLVAGQAAPEPSVGFARRVTRGLQDERVTGRFIDLSVARAGRRFVYAALTAALLLALGVLVPSSGPVRSPDAAAEAATQPEAVAAQNYPIFSGRLMDNDIEFAPPSGSR